MVGRPQNTEKTEIFQEICAQIDVSDMNALLLKFFGLSSRSSCKNTLCLYHIGGFYRCFSSSELIIPSHSASIEAGRTFSYPRRMFVVCSLEKDFRLVFLIVISSCFEVLF